MKRDHHIPLFHPRLVRQRAQAVSPERLLGLAAVIAPFIDHLRRGVLDAGADSGAALDEMRLASDRTELEVTAKLYRECRDLPAALYAELRQRHSNIRSTKRRPCMPSGLWTAVQGDPQHGGRKRCVERTNAPAPRSGRASGRIRNFLTHPPHPFSEVTV